MIHAKDLFFSYKIDDRKVEILKGLDFQIRRGEWVAIQGPSGSGKSTLFYLLGLLLKPTSGKILLDGVDVTRLSEDELTFFRNRKIGFIFQQFHLLARTSTLENILLPAHYPSETASLQKSHLEKAKSLAAKLGLTHHLRHLPNQLSGGQQQRVAIARALMKDVDLILADEPTGNLDSENAKQILDLLAELHQAGKTLILITHDPEVAQRCTRVLHFKDGQLINTEPPQKSSSASTPAPGIFDRPPPFSLSLLGQMLRSAFPLVRENIFRNKARSLLTMLGVIIGIAAVLAMITLGRFTQRKILETYEALGVNKLLIRGFPNWDLKAVDSVSVNFRGFNWERDFVPLPRLMPEIQFLSPIFTSWRNKAAAGGREIDSMVTSIGVNSDYLRITNRKLVLGRSISPLDLENRSPVCLIGSDIAQRLFSRTQPIGQILSVLDGDAHFPCQIIGVLGPVTANSEWSPPNLHLIMPYSYFQSVLGNRWTSQIHEVALQLASGADVETSGKKIKAYFEMKYGKSGRFNVDSDSTLVAQMKRFLNLFSVLLAAIAFLCLLVGGIGINNMMMISVSERIKEFGIRKALGATRRSVRVQVLLESLVICLMAGFLGVVFGFLSYEILIYGATQLVPRLKFEWIFEPVAAGVSLVSIVAVGILSGLIPAIKAEKLEVIEALRTE